MEGAAEDPECVLETGDAPSSFDLLEPPTSGGFLKLSKPCCYIFPGGKGDSALFAVNGFNILVDGGSEQKSCFWKLVRHLDRIDSVLLTHIGADNLPGINGLFQRKLAEREEEQSRGSGSSKNLISPELGVVFFNVPEKLRMPESTLTVKRSIKEAYLMLQHLNKLGITPEPLFRVVSNTIEPITLFHKLGVGKLDMYVLNPVKESKEMQFLMQKWSGNSKAKTGIIMSNGKEGEISVPYLTSVTALIVWIPHSPTEKIVRVLFPGNAPQNKIFEGLEKLKHLDFLRYPVATQKEMSSGAPPPVVKQTKMRSRTDSKESLKSSPKTSKKESGGKEDVSKSDLNKVNKVEKKEKKVKSESVKATKQQKNNEVAPQAAKLEKKKVSKEKSVKKDKTPKMDEKKDKEKTEITKEKHEVKKADKVKKDEKKEQKAKEDKKNDPNKLRKITKPDMKPLTPEVRKTLHRAKTQTKPKADKNKAAKAQTKEEMPVPKMAPEEEKPVPKTAPEETAATTLADRSIVSSPEDLTEDFEALRLEELSKMSGVPKNDATPCHLDYTDTKAPPTAYPGERTSSTDTEGGTLVQRGEDNRDTGAAAGQAVDRKYEEEKMETYDKYPSEEEVKDRSRKSDSSEEEGDVIEKADLEGAEDAEQLKNKADEARKEKPGRAWDSKPDELFSTPSTQVAAALASEQFSFIQDETIPGYSETEQTISDEEIHEEPEDRIPQLRYDVGSYDISVPDVPGTFDSMHGIKEMRSAVSGMDDVKPRGFGQSQDPMLASCPTIIAAPLAEEEHISSATSITEYDRLSSFPTSVAEDQSVASVTAPQTEETGRSSLHLDTVNSMPSHTEATHGKEYLHSAGTISPTSSLEEDKCFKSPPSEEYQPIIPEMEAGTTVKPVHEEEEEDEEDEEDQTPNVDIPLGKLQEGYEHAASVMLLEEDMSPATTAPRFPPLSPPCAEPESGFVHEAEDRCASPDDSTMKLATPVSTAGFSPAHESSLHDDTLGADKQKSERSVTISDMSSIIGQFADGTTFEASEESEESDEEEDDDDDYYVNKDLKPAVKAKLMEEKEGLFLDDDFTCEPKSPHEDKVLPQESSYLEDKELKAQECTYVPFSSEEKSKPQVMYSDDEDDDEDEDEKDSSKPLSVEQSKAASQYDKTTDYVVFKDPEKSVNFNLVDFPERESKENDRDMRQDTPYVHGKTFSYSDIYDSKASSVDSDMYQQESTDKLRRDCMKSYMDPPSLTTSGRTEGSHFTSSCGRDVSASPWLDDRTTSAPPPCGREQKAKEAFEYSRGSRFPSMADRPEASSTCLSSEKDLSPRGQTHGVEPTTYAADKPSATGYGEIDMRKLTAKDEEDYDDDVVEEDDDDDDYEDEEEEEEYAGESDIEKGAGEKSEKEVEGPVSDVSGSRKPELTPMAGYGYHRQGMPGTTESSSSCLTGKPAGLPGSPGGEREPFLFSDTAGQEAAEALEFDQQKATPLDSSTATAAPAYAYSSSSAYSYSSSTSGSLSTSRQLGEDPETPAAAEPLFEYSSFKEDEYLEVSEKQQPMTATSPQAPVSLLEEAGPPAFPSPTAAPYGSREQGCFYRPGWCGGSGPAGVEDRGASAGAFAQFSLASTEQESASAALYGITSSPRPDVVAKHYFEETDSSEEEEREEEGYAQERPRRSPGAPFPARTAAELSPATPSGGTAAGLAAGYKTAYEWEMPKAPLVPGTPTPAQQEGGLEPERPTRPLSLSSGFAPPLYAEEQRWAGAKHSDHGDHSDHDDDDDDSDQDQPTGASLAYAGRSSSGRGGGGELSPSFVNPQQLSSDEDEEERGCQSDQSQEGRDPSVRRRPQRPGGPGGLALATEDTPPTSASESLDSQSDGEPDEEPDDYLPTRGSRDPPPVPCTDLSPRPPHPDACMVDPEAPGGPRKEPRPKGLRKSSGKPKAGSPARRRKSPLPTRQTLSPGSATMRRKEADKSSRASRLSDGQASKEEELSRSSYATGRPLANGGKSSASPQKAGSAPSAIYVDLAYIPNHCNAKNVDQDFFKRVRSAYYVVSGNDPAGGEPSRTVLDALLDGKAQWGSNLQVTLIPTHDAEVTRDWYQQTHQRQQELNVMVLASSSTVVMQDESFSACKIEF